MLAISVISLLILLLTLTVSSVVYLFKHKKWKRSSEKKDEKESRPSSDFIVGAPLLVAALTFLVLMAVSVGTSYRAEKIVVSTKTQEIVINNDGYPVLSNLKKNENNSIWGIETFNPYIATIDVLNKETMSFVNIRIKSREHVVFTDEAAARYELRDIEFKSPLMKLFALEQPDDEYVLYLPASVIDDFQIDENIKVFIKGGELLDSD